MNALFIFILHAFLLKTQYLFRLSLPDGAVVNIKSWITLYLFNGLSQENASLCYSLLFLGFNFAVAVLMYHRKWFVRI